MGDVILVEIKSTLTSFTFAFLDLRSDRSCVFSSVVLRIWWWRYSTSPIRSDRLNTVGWVFRERVHCFDFVVRVASFFFDLVVKTERLQPYTILFYSHLAFEFVFRKLRCLPYGIVWLVLVYLIFIIGGFLCGFTRDSRFFRIMVMVRVCTRG
jgi:hypothetical protein